MCLNKITMSFSPQNVLVTSGGMLRYPLTSKTLYSGTIIYIFFIILLTLCMYSNHLQYFHKVYWKTVDLNKNKSVHDTEMQSFQY